MVYGFGWETHIKLLVSLHFSIHGQVFPHGILVLAEVVKQSEIKKNFLVPPLFFDFSSLRLNKARVAINYRSVSYSVLFLPLASL